LNTPAVKSMISTGMRVVDERRSHAGQLRTELVNEGRQAVDSIGGAIAGVIEGSLQRVRDGSAVVPRRLQSDLEHRLHALGFATRADLQAIEHQIARLVAVRAQAGAKPEVDPSYREVLRTTISG
jgi:hypothetical protein